MSACLKAVHGGVEIRVKVVPGASRDRVVGLLGDSLKVQVSAAPERGKANAAVVKLLARHFGVRAGDVVVIHGETSQQKIVYVQGASIDRVRTALGMS